MIDSNGYIRSIDADVLPPDILLEKKLRIYSLSRTIKFLAILDIVVSIYYAVTLYLPLILLSFLSWCGYYGAKTFKPKYILGYILCLSIYTALKAYILFISTNLFLIIFNTLCFIFSSYFLIVVYNFYNDLVSLPEEQQEELRNPEYQPQLLEIVYY